MRKYLVCVLMTTLVLAGCGPAGVSEAEQLALTIRGELLEKTSCSAGVSITADYGQRVYQYQVEVQAGEEETALTITAPETAAGITAHVTGEDSRLEYDGMWVETGPLNEEGLTPVSAVPALLRTARSGYITACALEENLLRVDCGDPEGTPGEGTESSLWFDRETHALSRGEIRSGGFRVILCEFSEFSVSQ